jgi:hypothetical protein
MTTDILRCIVDSISLVSILDNALLCGDAMSASDFRAMFATPLSSHKKSQLSFLSGYSQNMAATHATAGGGAEEGAELGMTVNGIPLICSGLDLIEACICRAFKTNYNQSTGFVADDVSVSRCHVLCT